MKERVTLSLEPATAAYLARKASESGRNVSAYVEQHFRAAALAESVATLANWYASQPDYATNAEAERYAPGAA